MMDERKSDRVLRDWEMVARSVRRVEFARRAPMRSSFSLATGTAVVALVALVAILVYGRPESPPPGSSPTTPVASASAGANPSESNGPSATAEREAAVVSRIPGIFGTGCSTTAAVTDNAIWLVQGSSIDRIDTTTNAIVAKVSPGLGPSLQLVSTGDSIWVAPGYCETGPAPASMVIKRISPATNSVDAAIEVGEPGVLTADDGRLWVSTLSTPRHTAPVDVATNTLKAAFAVDTIPVAACGALWEVEGSADGSRAILTKVDPDKGTKLGETIVEVPAIDTMAQIGGDCWVLAPVETNDTSARPPSELIQIDPGQPRALAPVKLPQPAIALGGQVWQRWSDPVTGIVRLARVDPHTGMLTKDTWVLPKEVGSAGLWAAEGTMWAQIGDSDSNAALIRLGIVP